MTRFVQAVDGSWSWPRPLGPLHRRCRRFCSGDCSCGVAVEAVPSSGDHEVNAEITFEALNPPQYPIPLIRP